MKMMKMLRMLMKYKGRKSARIVKVKGGAWKKMRDHMKK